MPEHRKKGTNSADGALIRVGRVEELETMSRIARSAVIDSIQRLFDKGTIVSLGEQQLLERFLTR